MRVNGFNLVVLFSSLLILVSNETCYAQEQTEKPKTKRQIRRDTTLIEPRDTTFVKKRLDTLQVGRSKSDYDDIVVSGGVNSVDADLRYDDLKKDAWTTVNLDKQIFDEYYDAKRYLKKKINLAIGTDYMLLWQVASFSFTNRNAASGIFRFFGTWIPQLGNPRSRGALIFKVENRHKIGGGEIPRELGYSAGSALSTASFKEFQWGLTNFYWKQSFNKGKYGLVTGIIDPGDWLDLYPLLNPYKFYLNEAFFNSPAMALPNQGLGVVVSARRIVSHIYLMGGIQDANGEPFKWLVQNFQSFFEDREYMYWIEAGWSPNPDRPLTDGRTIHLMYWHQDERSAQREIGDEVEESWGLNFSASKVFFRKYTAFLRAGYAVGNGATMRHLIHGGLSVKVVRHDHVGIGLHWGAPSDLSASNQTGLEAYYSFQLTDNLNITTDVQFTLNPSFNNEKDVVAVYSVFRIRYAM